MNNEVKVFNIWESNKGFSRVSVGTDLFKKLTNNQNPMPYKVSKDAKGGEVKVYTLEDGMKIWTRTVNVKNPDGSDKMNEKGYNVTATSIIMKTEDAEACKVSEPDETEQYEIDFNFDSIATA